MRLPLLVTCFAAACHPSATVQRTMPVANLQSYRTVGVRVQSVAAPWRGAAQVLDDNLLGRLTQECQFEHVVRANEQADLLVDVNITSMGRGGTGIVKNPGKATLDALLVLTDGSTGDLIGTAKINGESSGVIINNSRPENEAIDVVAKSVADLLASSGCTGPRVAKAEPPPDVHGETPPPPDPGKPPPPPVDESKRPDAEKLNDSGKDKLRSADVQGALADFQQADQMLPDPRYSFNLCLAYEAQEQWDQAATACNKAKALNPKPELASKIDARLGLIQHHQ
jgi:hypothetical protein